MEVVDLDLAADDGRGLGADESLLVVGVLVGPHRAAHAGEADGRLDGELGARVQLARLADDLAAVELDLDDRHRGLGGELLVLAGDDEGRGDLAEDLDLDLRLGRHEDGGAVGEDELGGGARGGLDPVAFLEGQTLGEVGGATGDVLQRGHALDETGLDHTLLERGRGEGGHEAEPEKEEGAENSGDEHGGAAKAAQRVAAAGVLANKTPHRRAGRGRWGNRPRISPGRARAGA